MTLSAIQEERARARDMTNGEIFYGNPDELVLFLHASGRQKERASREEEEEGTAKVWERERKSSWHIIKRGKFGTAGRARMQ